MLGQGDDVIHGGGGGGGGRGVAGGRSQMAPALAQKLLHGVGAPVCTQLLKTNVCRNVQEEVLF